MFGSHQPGAARLSLRLVLVACASFMSSAYAAQDELQEYQRREKAAEVMAPLGVDMFGDSVNNYTGALSFSVTDIDVPGNNALPVRIARTFRAAEGDTLRTYGALAIGSSTFRT